MGSENVFQENQEYLIKARELVTAIDDMQDNLDQARVAQRKTSRSISQEEKGLADEISAGVEHRHPRPQYAVRILFRQDQLMQ